MISSTLTLWFPPVAWSPSCPRCDQSSPCWCWTPDGGGHDFCGRCFPVLCCLGLCMQHGGWDLCTHRPAEVWSRSSSGPDGCESEETSFQKAGAQMCGFKTNLYPYNPTRFSKLLQQMFEHHRDEEAFSCHSEEEQQLCASTIFKLHLNSYNFEAMSVPHIRCHSKTLIRWRRLFLTNTAGWAGQDEAAPKAMSDKI